MMRKAILVFTCLVLFIGSKVVAQNEAADGSWGAPIPFGIVPVAVANLPDGRLLTWSSQFRNTFLIEGDGATFSQYFDPMLNGGVGNVDGAEFTINTDHDMFCPGINNLPDGRLLSAGGTSSEKTSIFDPMTGLWTVADEMNIPRGYQGNVTLQDGNVFTVGGSWSGGAWNNRDAEVWSPLTGWIRKSGIKGQDIFVNNDLAQENQTTYRVDNHVWLWPAPNGRLFHAGPSEMMHWIDLDSPNGSIVEAGIRQDITAGVRDFYSMKGNTVMFDRGKLLKTGGARAYGDDNIGQIPATERSFVIDIDVPFGQNPVVTYAGDMNARRTMHNSTVLPNGEVLITGGIEQAALFTDTNAVFGAEIYNPVTNTFRTVAAMTVPRTYHSVAILMPDGRVFVGGGGLCDSTPGCVDHFDAEIYSPPYLYDGNNNLATRPVITNIMGHSLGQGPYNNNPLADYGDILRVTTNTTVTEFSLIRFSAATHATNNEQRRIPLNTTPGTNHNLTIPGRNLLPPGYYMLFAMDTNGVPSVSRTLRIGTALPLDNNNNPNLVLDMRFDESSGLTAFDSSQYGHNGTVIQRDDDGDVEAADQFNWDPTGGLFGGAIEFDGLEFNSNSLLEIDYTPALATTARNITVSAWAYRNSNSGITQLEGKISNVGLLSHDYPGLFFGFHNTLYKWAFLADGALDCYAGYAPLDTWVHLAATYDGNVAKLYANGVEVCSREISGLIAYDNDLSSRFSKFTSSGFYDHRYDPDDPANLPASAIPDIPDYGNTSGITDEISGKIDQLRVYNKVLNPAEIQALYQEGLDQNNPNVVECQSYLVAEYRIGQNGSPIVGNTIVAAEGSEVFIRARNFNGEYFVTTPQYDGPTFSTVANSNRFTSDGWYQLDTHVNILSGLAPWDNPDRNNGEVDASNEGQFVLTTPQGCATTIYFSLFNANPGGGCPNFLQNDDATILISAASQDAGIDLVEGVDDDTNGSPCAVRIENLDSGELFARISMSVNLANYGIQPGNEIYFQLDGKGTNNASFEVVRNSTPNSTLAAIGGGLVQGFFSANWSTISRRFIVPPGTTTLDVWIYSNYLSNNPGLAVFDNLKIINLTATGGNLPPTADFTSSVVSGSSPLTVNFNSSGSTDPEGPINQVNWRFGDGNISSARNPSHIFTMPGEYQVLLTVEDSGGLKDSKTMNIIVTQGANTAPLAVASATPVSGTIPLVVTFSGAQSSDDSAVVSYAWDFGDGETANTQAPQHTYSQVGSFTATLTVTDAAGLTGTDTVTINVNSLGNEAPIAILSATPLSGTLPLEVNFTGNNSTDDDGIVSYLWDFGDGTSATTANAVHTYSAVGSFIAALTVTDGEGLTNSRSVTITVSNPVNQSPVAVASATATSGTVPLLVNFTGSNSTDDNGIVSYLWDFGDGNAASTANAQNTYTSTGSFTAMLTVTDSEGLTNQQSLVITVSSPGNQQPVATASATPMSGMAPLPVAFTGSNSTDDSGIVTYAWDFGDGNTSNTADPQHTYTGTGTFTATLSVTDADGIMDQQSLAITVNSPGNNAPVAIASASPVLGSVPLLVRFRGSNSTDDNGVVSYAWDFGDGNSASIADPQHTYTSVGSFTAMLTVTDAMGITAQQTLDITANPINQAPVASFTADPTNGNAALTVNLDASISTDDNGVTSYRWDFGDGTFGNGARTMHLYNAPGIYTIQLTVSDNEGLSSTDTKTVTVLENIVLEENKELSDIAVFPNPVSGKETLKIDLSDFPNQGLVMALYTIYGKLVIQQLVEEDHEDIIEMNVSKLQDGVYLLELTKNDESEEYTIKKIIKAD